jgi:hypothetical protein
MAATYTYLLKLSYLSFSQALTKRRQRLCLAASKLEQMRRGGRRGYILRGSDHPFPKWLYTATAEAKPLIHPDLVDLSLLSLFHRRQRNSKSRRVDSDIYGPFADIVANRASTKSPVPKFASNRFPAPSRDSRHGRSGYLPVTWSWGRLDRVARKCNWADK